MVSVPRPSSSLVSFWVAVGFGLLLLGDAIFRGDWRLFVVAATPTLLVIWALWIFLYRPSIRFGAVGLMVVNPGRVIEVPWTRLSSVTQRFQVVLELDDGSHVTCWGSPFPEKPGLHRPTPDSARRPRPGGDIASALEAARETSQGTGVDAPVRHRWDRLPLAVGAVLVLGCLTDLVFAL
jgi:hypothetical protein